MSEVQLRMEAQSSRAEELPEVQNPAGCSPKGIVYKLCKRGHVRSPDNVDKLRRCRKCLADDAKLRYQTPEKKLYMLNYHQTSECKKRVALRERTQKHKTYRKAYQKEYNKTYEKKKLNDKKRIVELHDSYIATTLRLSTQFIPPELMELKRVHIQLQREIKNANSQKHARNDYRRHHQPQKWQDHTRTG